MFEKTNQFLELLIAMTKKELKARYKFTIFGFLWLVINPLLQMLIIGFVFSFVMKEMQPHYNYFLFTGLLVWNFFSTSLTKATPSIVFERTLIKKSKFPKAIIPLSIITSNLINLVLAMLLFIIPLLFLQTLSFLSVIVLIFAFVLLLATTVGLTLFTSAINVRFRDVNFFVQAGLIIWFYATPIIYTLSVIPQQFLWLWSLNPLTLVMQLFQFALLSYPFPTFEILIKNTIITVVLFILGVYIFSKESENFDDWV